MRQKIKFGGLILAVVLAACTSSPFKQVWVSPEAGPVQFEKTLIVAMTESESDRRVAEDALVRQMTPLTGVASYRELTPEQLRDVEKAKVIVRERGFDGALVLVVLGTRQESQSQPIMTSGFWGYYGARSRHLGMGVSAEMPAREFTVLELSLYSVTTEQLIWSGKAEISQTRDLGLSIEALGQQVLDDLRARSLL